MKKSNKPLNNFLKKCGNKFKNKYDYSKIDYIDSTTPIKIICNKHNISFWQEPVNHLRGNKKCVLCGGNVETLNDFLVKAKHKHGNKYNYSKAEYVNSKTKITIICPKHGEFKQLPNGHYKSGCQKCHIEHNNINETLNNFLTKAKKTHGDKYEYSKVNYVNSKTKITIICPKHGEFEQFPYNHIRGKGCPSCGIESTKNKLTLSNKEFINKAKIIHSNKYGYDYGDYINMTHKYNVTCPIHGEFKQLPYDHLSGHGCPKCSLLYNKSENEVKEYIKSLNFSIIENNRTLISPFELDIYIPSKKIAIEYDGLYWHSELYKDKNYHLNKTELAKSKGVKLIHIFEDEWLNKKNIVKSRLKNILGLTETKIYGRKCEIKEISIKISKDFFNNNHLQGYANSSIKIGLYYNNNLISMMLFSKPRLGIGGKYNGYELTRFCNKLDTTVVGGASKLLKYFIKKYNPNKIISYADIRWSNGELYNTIGFNKIRINKPNYWYIVDKNRKHRFGFRKSKLKKMGYDVENKTEKEIMNSKNIYRIYDCGTITYEKTLFI